MAEGNDSDQEKTEDPTSHRIDEFRKRGEVAASKELTSVLILGASIMTLLLSIVFIYEQLGNFVEWVYALDVSTAFTEKSMKTIVYKTFGTAGKCAAPILLVVACMGIIANVAQIGFLYSPEVLNFKPERLNPISGFKKIFSMRSVVEALKGALKFIFILSIVAYFLKDDLDSFKGFFHADMFQSFLYGKSLIGKLAFAILGGMLIIAAFDFGYQKMSYQKKLRMTKEEVKKESKEQDGNPEVKQKIRAIQREMAQKRMIAEIPNADVIITNPTHLSIVLKYDHETMISPMIMGKGADHMALKIREIAKEHNIPIVENVPLARSLFKTVKEGSPVPRNLYKAVAEVLAFVYKLKKKKKALG